MHTSGRSVLQQLSYFIHGRIQWPLKVAPPAESRDGHDRAWCGTRRRQQGCNYRENFARAPREKSYWRRARKLSIRLWNRIVIVLFFVSHYSHMENWLRRIRQRTLESQSQRTRCSSDMYICSRSLISSGADARSMIMSLSIRSGRSSDRFEHANQFQHNPFVEVPWSVVEYLPNMPPVVPLSTNLS